MTGHEALRSGAAAFGIGLLATAFVRSLAHRIGWLSRPNPLVPQHDRPVAYLGGVAVAAASALAFAIFFDNSLAREVRALVVGLIFLGLGLLDDARALTAAPKFAWQAAAAALAVGWGIAGTFTRDPVLDAVISFLWIVTLVNAFNFLDVCDGLLAGVAALCFGYIAIALPAHAVVAACVCGATLGFLVFNRPRATIFLGDAGSHFLGFMAAALTLTARPSQHGIGDAATSAVALGIPLFEFLFITSVRIARGVPWWRGSQDHIALRLQSLGWGQWRTDLFAWAWGLALAALALSFSALPSPWPLALGAALFACALAGAWWLLRHTEPRLGSQAAAQRG